MSDFSGVRHSVIRKEATVAHLSQERGVFGACDWHDDLGFVC